MNKISFYSLFFNLILRGVSGLVAIYLLNIFLGTQGILAQVGMNGVTFLTTGTLGFPGVALLYGITIFQIL